MSIFGTATEKLKDVANLPTIAIAALYVLGLLITTIYLSAFGVFDFSALKLQFILTGMLFVVFLAGPALPLLAAIFVWRRHGALAAAVTAVAVLAVASRAVLYLTDFSSYADKSARMGHLWGWEIYWLSNAGGFSVLTPALIFGLYAATGWCAFLWLPRTESEATAGRTPWSIVAAVLVAVFVSAMMVDYVFEKHRHLAAAFGGAAYGALDLRLSEDGQKALCALGVPLSPDHLFEHVPVVYEAEKFLVVMPPAYSSSSDTYWTIRVPKDSVIAGRWTNNVDLVRKPPWFADARDSGCLGLAKSSK